MHAQRDIAERDGAFDVLLRACVSTATLGARSKYAHIRFLGRLDRFSTQVAEVTYLALPADIVFPES